MSSDSLWQLALVEKRPYGTMAEPWGQDTGRYEALFIELYAAGERPTLGQLREFVSSRLATPRGSYERAVGELWARRLRKPFSEPRSIRALGQWPTIYPFAVLEGITDTHGLEPIGPRLLRVLKLTARTYLALAEASPGTHSTLDAERALRAAEIALTVWGSTRDRCDDSWWAAAAFGLPPRTVATFSYATRRGRADREAWVERSCVACEAAFPPGCRAE